MTGIMICWAAAVWGIDVGWQPLPDGGLEYIIQVEPETLDALRGGDPIESSLPPQLKDVRKYRVVVGRGKLPRELPANTPPALGPSLDSPGKTEEKPAERSTSRSAYGAGPWNGNPLGIAPAKPAEAPKPLPSEESAKPLAEKQAGYMAAGTATKEPLTEPKQPTPTEKGTVSSEQPARPWLPLSLACIALCGSLGANFYLGWLFRDARTRYRALLTRTAQTAMG